MTEIDALTDKLRSEGEKTVEFFAGLSSSQWEVEVYTENAVWTIRSTLAHLVSAEWAFVQLFKRIQQGGPGVSEDFVIDRYNASQQREMQGLSPQRVLASYREARAEMVSWVSTLANPDLEMSGRHPYLGITTLREMLKMIYIHNQMHLRDIRRALKH